MVVNAVSAATGFEYYMLHWLENERRKINIIAHVLSGADLGVGQGGPGPPRLIQTYTNLQQQTRTED